MPRTPVKPVPGSLLNDLPFCLARVALGFRRFNQRTLREVGADDLAPGLASILHAVEESGDCTINDLIRRTHLPNGTLTGLLDALENDEYIKRIPNPRDGRSWLIALTKRGRRLCEKLHVRHEAVMNVFRKAFTSAEIGDFTALLERATTCMKTYVVEDRKKRRR